MRNPKRPMRVALMDDDCMASKWLTLLLTRDLYCEVSAETNHPDHLLAQVSSSRPDLILLDPEYRSAIPLSDLIQKVGHAAPHVPVLCLSQYGDQEVVSQAILSGVRGFLLKQEVQLALAATVLRSLEYDFIYSSGIERQLFSQRLPVPAHRRFFRPWQPDPHLSNRHLKAIWLTVVFGMSARMAGYEAGLSENSIHTYITETRDILIHRLSEVEPVVRIANKPIPTNDETYLLFTRVEEE